MANGKRTRNIFDPTSKAPFALSRSKIEMFLRCPRCFYLDRRLGIGQPPMPAFTLNTAVDILLKTEFDGYRSRGVAHPLMIKFGVEAIPYKHHSLDEWRDNRKGVRHHDAASNFLFFGAVDDLWINPKGHVYVVDYKSTSIDGTVSLDGRWKDAYKRQAEMYQWLLSKNGLHVSSTAYFVYVNADKSRSSFDDCLTFLTVILPYDGDSSWVSDALHEARICLDRDSLPPAHPECEWCAYRRAAGEVE